MDSSNPRFGSSTFDPDSIPFGLQGNPIPPFLCKTFDLVDEPNLDPIISWGPTGESFVVWDIVEFSRIILPRNFKHNNFSSFVRQLNTYGFRKVDADKWEFANERFLRGKKHLLKNIQRRKSSNQSQTQLGETPRLGLRCEIENLRAEKSVMMQEVIQLQQQIRGTAQGVERVKHKLEASEKRQKQIVSFLVKVIQSPEFVGSPRTKRKFLKQKHLEPELLEGTTPNFLLEDGFSEGDMAFPIEGILLDELEASSDLFKIPEQSEDMGEYLVSFPEELTKQRDFPEFSSSGFDDIFNQEEAWRMDFDISATGMSSCPDLWGNFASYEGPLRTSESPSQFIDPENGPFKKRDSDDGFKSSIDT